MPRHIIEKQTIELRLPIRADAAAHQQSASSWFWAQAVPVLERLFDRLVPGDEVVRLDKLEVQLGRVGESMLFTPAFLELLEQKVEEAILAELKERKGKSSLDSRQSRFEAWQFFLENGRLPWYAASSHEPVFREPLPPTTATAWKDLEAKLKTAFEKLAVLFAREEWPLEEVVQYLQKRFGASIELTESAWRGWLEAVLPKAKKTKAKPSLALPIAMDEQVAKAIETIQQTARQWGLSTAHWLVFLETGRLPLDAALPETMLKSVLDTVALDQFAPEQLRRLFRKNQRAIERLALQHRGGFLKNILALFTALPQDELWEGIEEIKRFFAKKQPMGFASARQLEVAIWVAALRLAILEHQKLAGGELLWRVLQTPELAKAVLPAIRAAKRQRQKLKVLATVPIGGVEEAAKLPQPTIEKPLSEQLEQTTDMDEGIHIGTAGIVLVHPYLTSLFAALELTDEQKQFRSEAHQAKGVHLLHYLATKQTEAPESELLLPKILCGMAPDSLVDRFVELSDAERTECEELLEAIISNWGALGRTSPDGLREGFLQRDGKLVLKESGWHLRVERKTVDVLLDRVSWNLGLVKLPWMDSMMTVEWR